MKAIRIGICVLVSFTVLAHGTVDDNVPPNNTTLVVDALIKANKDFDLLMLPNQAHGYGAMAPYMQAPKPEQAMPFIVLLMLPLFVYLLFVSARILRAAIERPMFQCVMLVLLQTFLEPLLLLALFGPGETASAAVGG